MNINIWHKKVFYLRDIYQVNVISYMINRGVNNITLLNIFPFCKYYPMNSYPKKWEKIFKIYK